MKAAPSVFLCVTLLARALWPSTAGAAGDARAVDARAKVGEARAAVVLAAAAMEEEAQVAAAKEEEAQVVVIFG